MKIEYKPVYRIEYGSRYVVSTMGHIFRVKVSKDGQTCYTPILPYWSGKPGYKRYQVNLYDSFGNIWKISASKLILASMLGFPDDYKDNKSKYFVRYKDGDPSHISLDNLEWCKDRDWISTIVRPESCQPVKCLETAEIFQSIKECANSFKSTSKTISRYLNTPEASNMIKFRNKYTLIRLSKHASTPSIC